MCKTWKYIDKIEKVVQQIENSKMIDSLMCFDLISDYFFYLWL